MATRTMEDLLRDVLRRLTSLERRVRVTPAFMKLLSIRLTSTSDVSYTSTGHAFQVGPDSGQNLGIDQNEILARDGSNPGDGSAANPAGSATLHLNADGGEVRIGNNIPGSKRIVFADGHVDYAAGAWAMAAGVVATQSIPASSSVTDVVTYPVGRFTASPIMGFTRTSNPSHGADLILTAQAVSGGFATSFTIVRVCDSAGSRTVGAHWTATQMTSTSGSG